VDERRVVPDRIARPPPPLSPSLSPCLPLRRTTLDAAWISSVIDSPDEVERGPMSEPAP